MKKDKSPKVHQKIKIGFDFEIRERDDLTEKQLKTLELIEQKSSKIIFIEGPAGVSKTFLGILAGLRLLRDKKVSDILYIRSIAESAVKSLGSLPGEMDNKLEPFLMPLYDKLDELLDKNIVDKLVKEERIIGLPVNYIRGASWNSKFVILDESQNLTFKEIVTVLTRLGKYSKLVICGDKFQSDINGKSGFKPIFDIFDDAQSIDRGIHSVTFDKNDIVRSELLGFVLEKLENYKANKDTTQKPPQVICEETWNPSVK